MAVKIRGKRRRAATVDFYIRLHDSYLHRRVAETFIGHGKKRIRISTILLTPLPPECGLPDEWETKVFGGPLADWELKDETRCGAVLTHRVVVTVLRATLRTKARRVANRRRMHATYARRRGVARA